MTTARTLGPGTAALALLAATFALAAPPATAADGDVVGEAEFRRHCAVCHGIGARGAGPLAGLLREGPIDLTQLTKQNDGVFPLDRIYRVIDGRYEVAAHGTRSMPVWGERYMKDAASVYGPGDVEKLRERVVQGRILELVFYLQTVQEE